MKHVIFLDEEDMKKLNSGEKITIRFDKFFRNSVTFNSVNIDIVPPLDCSIKDYLRRENDEY